MRGNKRANQGGFYLEETKSGHFVAGIREGGFILALLSARSKSELQYKTLEELERRQERLNNISKEYYHEYRLGVLRYKLMAINIGAVF